MRSLMVGLFLTAVMLMASCSKIDQVSVLNKGIEQELGYQNEVQWSWKGSRRIMEVNIFLRDNQSFDHTKKQSIKQFIRDHYDGNLDSIRVNILDR